MFFKTALLAATGLAFGLTNALPNRGGYDDSGHSSRRNPSLKTFNQTLLFDPPDNYTDPQVLYARTVQLMDGRLLATWENYSPEPPLVWFPIYESTNGGQSWKEVGKVTDDVNGWGLRYQPFLYELREDIGSYKKGTILCAGNSLPTDLSKTQIDVYASTDKGRTWEFVSHVASGGRGIPNNGETPVWEPYIIIYEGTLILYYSDQRDPNYGQKLVHQETTDLLTWSEVIDDVTSSVYTDRPGMPGVTQLPTGQYFYSYEWGGAPILNYYSFPVYYRIADDPRDFLDAPNDNYYIKSNNGGVLPISSPYPVWSPVGGVNGTIIVSSGSKPLFYNRCLGDPSCWVAYDPPENAAYTRSLHVMEQNKDYLLICGAGKLPPSSTNRVTCSMIKISTMIGL